MTNITLAPFIHNLKSCLALKFPYHFESKEIIKKLEGVRWTKTYKCFYIVYDELTIETFKDTLESKGFKIIVELIKTAEKKTDVV